MVGKPDERIDRHKDGSIKAKGCTINGVLTGYWEWFRKDGTKMRSGYFENGKQAGEWTTYDAKGKAVKVTRMKPPRREPPPKSESPAGGWGGALSSK
jgi:antitoxin component YwqK of YwqJK toxin-antitoxin module